MSKDLDKFLEELLIEARKEVKRKYKGVDTRTDEERLRGIL